MEANEEPADPSSIIIIQNTTFILTVCLIISQGRLEVEQVE